MIESAYSIPWTRANLKKIIKETGLPPAAMADIKVQYSVRAPNGMRLTVETLEDLMYGKYDELLHFGRIPTEQERKQWLEKQGGSTADIRRMIEFARNRARTASGQPQEAPMTATNVQEIIRREIQDQQQPSKV